MWLSLLRPAWPPSRLPSGASPASRQEPPRANQPFRELGVRAKLAPSGIGRQSQAQSRSWRCCCELFSRRNVLHGFISMAKSALFFGAFSCAGLQSERKASSIKANLPGHTFRDGFSSSLLLVLKSGWGLTPLKTMEPNQHKSKENQDCSSKKHLFPLLPRLLLLQIYKSLY